MRGFVSGDACAENYLQALAAVEAPRLFKNHLLAIEPSIGIALQHGPNFDASALMRMADDAMVAAKRSAADGFIILKA